MILIFNKRFKVSSGAKNLSFENKIKWRRGRIIMRPQLRKKFDYFMLNWLFSLVNLLHSFR